MPVASVENQEGKPVVWIGVCLRLFAAARSTLNRGSVCATADSIFRNLQKKKVSLRQAKPSQYLGFARCSLVVVLTVGIRAESDERGDRTQTKTLTYVEDPGKGIGLRE